MNFFLRLLLALFFWEKYQFEIFYFLSYNSKSIQILFWKKINLSLA